MKNIKLIGFDLDGTLVDSLSQSYSVDSALIKKYGGRVPSFEEYRQALTTWDWDDFYGNFGVKGDIKMILREYHDTLGLFDVKATENARNLLEGISNQNIPTFLVSISEKKERVIKKLKNSGLDSFFDEDSIHATGNKKAGLISREYKKRGISPRETMFIGDSAIDINGANSAGVLSVGVYDPRYSFNTYKMLKSAKPDYLFKDLNEFLGFLED